MSSTRKIAIVVGAVALLALVFVGWQGARAWMAWNRIERVGFDLERARSVLPPSAPDQTDVPSPAPTVATVEYDTVLIIGSDQRPLDQVDRQESVFADAVMLYMLPSDGSGPLIVSFPRDLVVVNPCGGEETKLDRTLEGCGADIGGEELVALAIEDLTGLDVDSFASFRFEAFVTMIDSVGGVEICVPNALREGETDILPKGCSIVDGERGLLWLRSRTTQEFIDGAWRFSGETGDAARVMRQQALIFALLDRLKSFRSPSELLGLAEQLGDTIVLDEALGLSEAVAMVWDLRSVGAGSIRTLVVPTEPTILDDGSFAVRATLSFANLIGIDQTIGEG